MPYGTLKVDNIIFTNGGVDQTITVSGIVASTSGNLTVTGTISGDVIRGGTTVSGATVTGAVGQFGNLTAVSGTFTTQISGATVTGTTANFTSGNFTSISGGTHTITSGVFAAGTAANPSISFTSDPNTGIYSPGADQVAISTNGTGRLFVDASGNVGVGPVSTSSFQSASSTVLSLRDTASSNIASLKVLGGAGAGAIAEYGATNGIGFCGTSGAHDFAFYTNSSERMRLTSTGALGLGTSSPGRNLDIVSSDTWIRTARTSGNAWIIGPGVQDAFRIYDDTAGVERFRIEATTGNVGIGTTSPGALLDVTGSNGKMLIANGTASNSMRFSVQNATGTGNAAMVFESYNLEYGRFDTSGRFLVGTSSSPTAGQGQYAKIVVQVSTYASTGAGILSVQRGSTAANTDTLGQITFGDSTGGTFATIDVVADGTVSSASDLPGRLVFSTTADGASSPTERMRIGQNGIVLIGATSNNITQNGFFSQPVDNDYYLALANNSGSSSVRVLNLNRQATDGVLVDFRQADAIEGTISVSGTAVSYNGGHLARWSQLPNNEDPSNILRGTVLSNLDEMCEWGDEDNEQLNKTKVSDVDDDPNVAGVFVSTSFDEAGPLDFFIAMTGDMIIRIAEGVTIQRGDLLVSAGDGTARPQGDRYIKDSTIAKVTSTHVTCTYDDGSYCVPCVLMAC